MPIVFASSILVFPMFVFRQINVLVKPGTVSCSPVTAGLADAFSYGRGYIYNTCYILLIYLFCYFWVAVTFNPKDISENLKDYGSFIPGYRPGARTAQFLEQVMTRITYLGAAFLAMVAVIPTLISHWMDIPYHGGQLLRRHGTVDRRLGRARSRAKDRQPPGDAELSGIARFG